jgi:hypothetical protein
MKRKPLPSQKELRRVFQYDPSAPSCLRWKVGTYRNTRPGDVAGYQAKDGRWTVRFQYQLYYVSNIIYKMRWGTEPPQIDHRNLDHSNNRIHNLRRAAGSQNWYNRKVRSDSSTGVKGVRRGKMGHFFAAIKVGGKYTHLGTFDTKEKASEAYAEAARRFHGKFARVG